MNEMNMDWDTSLNNFGYVLFFMHWLRLRCADNRKDYPEHH